MDRPAFVSLLRCLAAVSLSLGLPGLGTSQERTDFAVEQAAGAEAAGAEAAKFVGRPGAVRTPVGLPSQHGQVWKEYPLQEYTSRVTTTARPEQAVVDWILRETGTEVWFAEPLGLMSADRDTLRVYHTQEMHRLVQEVVDRLVTSKAETYGLGIRLVTVNNPNWRGKVLPLMRSVAVQSPGVDAWLLTKENAVVLLGDLRQRADFREHQSPILTVPNGQAQSLSRLRPRNYVRAVQLTSSAIGYELETSQIQEGYAVQISPLVYDEGRSIDAVIKCQIDQIESLIPVTVELPSRQTVRIEVPQLVSWRLHERFRWSTENVLLLSCGVVATPSETPTTASPLPKWMGAAPSRADALLFIEFLGPATPAMVETAKQTARQEAPNRGRY